LFADGRRGERIYRTGDLGRIAHDGKLRFLGRRDGQTKVQGVRIELNEVEHVLAGQAGIAQCAVVGRVGRDGGQVLAAFLVPTRPSEPGAYRHASPPLQAALRARLTATLDRRAVPAHFIVAAELPRTPTGKVDAAALRQIDPGSLAVAESPAEPTGTPATADVAARVRQAWRTVLPACARDDDNFFDAGGDSLAAVRLHDELERACPGMFRLIDIYAHPSVRKMCEAVSSPEQGREPAIAEGVERALRRKGARPSARIKEAGDV
jgi:hypothetical protein